MVTHYPMPEYLALIGDLVDSKQLARRAELQQRLAAVLRELNRRSRPASPFTLTLGDEFQAVYASADTLFGDVLVIMRRLHPVRVRFAIGLGAIATPINRQRALGMDGPAFHRAREAMTELKNTPYRVRIRGESAGPERDDPWTLLNHLFNFVTHQLAGWKPTRLRVLQGLLQGDSVSELAKELRISKVAVYKNINAAALDEVRGLCSEVTRLLNRKLKRS